VFDRWHEYQQLLKEFRVYVYPRPGYSLDKLMDNMELLSGLPPIEVSSTQIRERVRRGEPIDSLVPVEVRNYIRAHGLYNQDQDVPETDQPAA
jgi:nicotinate-nucleotide adenylyltransferase